LVLKGAGLFDGRPKRVLHFAPERAFASRLRAVERLEYVTADLMDPNPTINVDITNMFSVPDLSFDFLYRSHVLEHVADDGKAIQEGARVLKQDGRAVFMMPITAQVAVEDPRSPIREKWRGSSVSMTMSDATGPTSWADSKLVASPCAFIGRRRSWVLDAGDMPFFLRRAPSTTASCDLGPLDEA
jgi:SAM-dependent methyltransferase